MTNTPNFRLIENPDKKVSPIYYWAIDELITGKKKTFYYFACGKDGTKEHGFAQDYYGKGIEPLLETPTSSYGTLKDLAAELFAAKKQGFYPSINAVAPHHEKLQQEVCEKGTINGKEFYKFVETHREYKQLLPHFEARQLNQHELIMLRALLGITPPRVIYCAD